jgi:hypothetical protein
MADQPSQQENPSAERPQGAEAREPFVPPSVVHLGGLDVRTLLTGP